MMEEEGFTAHEHELQRAVGRRSVRCRPLPRITGLRPDDRLAVEDRHGRESFTGAGEHRIPD